MAKNPPVSAGNRVQKILWKRKWHPAPVVLPGESHGQRSLAAYSLQGSQKVRHDCVTEHVHVIFANAI